jgi:ArsR family transcriptional regulator, arsenate/arsenite/antimonite-responsive transcriptional repressor
MKSKEVVESLSALASEPRLALYRLLVKRGPKGFTPSELSERLEIPAPTLSFHLKELARADLLVSRREGRNLYYSPNFESVRALVGFLTENCCSLSDETCDEGCDENCQPTTVSRARKSA